MSIALGRSVCMFIVLIQSTTALALPVFTHNQIQADVSATVRAGFGVATEKSIKVPRDGGAFLSMARLSTGIKHQTWGGLALQLAGDYGEVALLDAYVHLHPFDGFSIQLGRFRTPVSLAMTVPDIRTPFINRPLIITNAWVPDRRIGLEFSYTRQFQGFTWQGSFGAFNPGSQIGFGAASSLMLKTQLSHQIGITWHTAYFHSIPAEGLVLDRQLDMALGYRNDGWWATVEVVLPLRSEYEKQPIGGYLQLLKRFNLPGHKHSIEPGVRAEFYKHDITSYKFTGGLTYYIWKDHLASSFNYAYEKHAQEIIQHFLFQLHGSF